MKARDYAGFCMADSTFFEALDRLNDDGTHFVDPGALDERSWRRVCSGTWVRLAPMEQPLPAQGWKVHVSTTLDSAQDVFERVWYYCVARKIAFKYLRSKRMLHATNEKNFPREQSGKFITIFPVDDEQLAAILRELGDQLAGFKGPYILGDLRYGDGPLYVRYGAFKQRWRINEVGEREPAILDAVGAPVPDRRGASFAPPSWIAVPEFLKQDLAERERPIQEAFRYDIERALQFSNAGGLYVAVGEGGVRVLIREARPYAALDARGDDAVTRLDRHRRALDRLAGLPCVPQLLEYRVIRDHHYLVEEFIEGSTLHSAMLGQNPMSQPEPSVEQREQFVAWVDHKVAQVRKALRRIHERGVAFGDLHPGNIILRSDDAVVLVDFELAGTLADPRAPGLVTPGFHAKGLAGREADLFALDRLQLAMLLPVLGLLQRDPNKLSTVIDRVATDFDLPATRVSEMQARMADRHVSTSFDRAGALFADAEASWRTLRSGLISAILGSATPERNDRLFPGDPKQFGSDGLDLAHGAAGVLYTLDRVGERVDRELVDWLEQRSLAAKRPSLGALPRNTRRSCYA